MGLLKVKRDGKAVAYRLDKAAVIVGSAENCNIRITDAGLVGRHCQILKMNGGYVLRDMSGEAGTFVNGKKVKEHLLGDQDVIQMGKEKFTFAEQEGANTARVAVSVAPAASAPQKSPTGRVATESAPAKTTGRVAAVPAAETPRKTTQRVETVGRNTGRIAAPPPAAEAPRAGTQRMNKPPTGRTGAVGKATGATKKITARTAASMGYQTSRSTFAMPSTRKGKLFAIGGVLLILAIGGLFFMINAGKVKPDEVKLRMAAQMDEIRKKYKPDQIIEIDLAVEAVLSEHLSVRPYVNELYTRIEKEHVKIHQEAFELKKAMKEVDPFFKKYAAIKANPVELKKQASALYDEAKSLIDSYGNTLLASRLREIVDELKKYIEDNPEEKWEPAMIGLQRDVQVATKKGDFKGAGKAIDDFGVKFKAPEKADLFKRLKEEHEQIKRQSDAFVKKETDKATRELAAEGAKKDEIKKRLEGYKAGLEGFAAALEKLEAFIATIK